MMSGPGLLHRHVAKRYVANYGVCLVFLVGLFVVMDLFEKLDELLEAAGEHGSLTTAIDVGLLYLFFLPSILSQIFPFVTLTAAVITSVRLRAANELVPMLAGGRSARVVAAPYFAFAVVVIGLTFLLQEQVLPQVAHRQRALATKLKGEDETVIDEVPILRDASGLRVVAAGYAPGDDILLRVTSTGFEIDGREHRLAADRLVFRRGEAGVGWFPEGARITEIGTDEAIGVVEDARPWPAGRVFPLRLSPAEIDVMVRRADPLAMAGLASWQLERLVAQSPENDALRYQLYFQLGHPLLNVVLLFLAVPIALRNAGRNTVLAVGVCLAISALYIVCVALLRDVAFRGALHPLIAAGAPLVLFTAAGLVLFDSTRT